MNKAFTHSIALTLASVGCAHAQTVINLPADTRTQTATYEYHPDGRLKFERLEPDGAASVKLVVEHIYEAGYVDRKITTGWDGSAETSREVKVVRTPDGRFPASTVNALQHTQRSTFDPRFSLPASVTDANGVVTRFEYDNFGRKTKEKRGYSSESATTYVASTDWSYERCAQLAGGCASVQGVVPVTKVSEVVRDGAGNRISAVSATYLDKLGRTIRAETEMLRAGRVVKVWQDTLHDPAGNVRKVSNPYAEGETPVWTEFTYDALSRKSTDLAPNGLLTTFSYPGLRTDITVRAEGGDRVKSLIKDPLGRLRETNDANSRTSYYEHDAFGNRTHFIDTYGNTIVTSYDVRGRKVGLTDPDMGTWAYGVNAFGEQYFERSPTGATATSRFDALGRVTLRQEADLNSQFSYDTATKGKGALAKTWTDNGYCRVHEYDSLGRPKLAATGFGGSDPCTSAGAQTRFSTSRTYDTAGRLDTLVYPTGLVLKHSYHGTLGFLQQVHNHTGGVQGAIYWKWQESDARGNVTKYLNANNVQTLKTYDPQTGRLSTLMAGSGGNASLGNVQFSGYDYSDVGDLRERYDRFDLRDLVEKAGHDMLGRLAWYARYSDDGAQEVAGSRVSLSYDAIGNIKSKTDTGTYYYNRSGPGSQRPHAVAEVRGKLNASYTYDQSDGQMLAGDGHTFGYSQSGMVTESGNATGCHRFLYQSESLRMQQSVYRIGCRTASEAYLSSRTYYLHPDGANGLLFEQETRGGSSSYKHYVNAGSLLVGVLTTTTPNVPNNTTGTMEYFHYDHLGSLVAVTNASGSVTQRRSFDPWGRPRATTGEATDGELPGGLAPSVDRGFTLHEHLEGQSLVHMNGRVYDFKLGRFVSPDPTVPNPDDAQSFNRYAYGANRPLNSVDPTGFSDIDYYGQQTATPYSNVMLLPQWLNYAFGFGAGNDKAALLGSFSWGSSTDNVALTAARGAPTNTGMPLKGLPDVAGALVEEQNAQASQWLAGLETAKVKYKAEAPTLSPNELRFIASTACKPCAVVDGAYSSYEAGNPAPLVLALAGIRGAPAAKGAAPFSHLVPGGGLAAHEAAGGHLIARHVGQTEAALAARLAGQPRLGAASTFASRAEAEAAISGALNARAAEVNAWVAAGARGRLVIDGAFSGGSVLQRGAAAAVPGTGVRAVLEGTGGGGWRIITGYPTP